MAELLVVDDHPLFREGFAHMTRSLRPAWTVRFADSAGQALAAVARNAPDLLVVDVGLPDENGFTLVQALAGRHPPLPVLLISGRDDAAVRVRARACGASGFVAKSVDFEQIAAAIEAALAGRDAFGGAAPDDAPVMTPRQAEVLMLLAEGHGNKEIRYRLGIAERTVRAHMTDLFELLGANSRTQAIIRARELGFITT